MQTADLFSELSRPSWEGVGRRREERRREEKRREERGEEGVGRGFQEGTVSRQHAACPGAQASPPAFKEVLSPENTGEAPRRGQETQVANPDRSGTSRLRSVCNKRRAPLIHTTISIFSQSPAANAKIFSHTFSHISSRPSHVPVPV